MERRSRTAEEIKRDAERMLGSKSVMGAKLPLDETIPSSPPPRNMSPPPISTPTSKAERDAAALRAKVQDLEEELAKQKEAARAKEEETPKEAQFDVSIRGLNVKMVLTTLFSMAGLILGGNATYRQLKAPPEAIAAQGTNLGFVKEDVDKAKKKEEERTKYEKELREAYDCRFGQMAAVFARQGYRLPNFPEASITWLQEYRETPGVVRKTPQFYPEKWCPDIPNPP